MFHNRVASFAPGLGAGRDSIATPESLAPHHVHLWLADITQPRWAAVAEQTLDSLERSRAQDFARLQDAQRFVHGRAALRQLLARYLQCQGRDIAFEYGPAGKPSLSPVCGGDAVRFNISHSGQWALIAIARGVDVGVDIEHMRDDFDVLQLAEDYFTVDEAAACAVLAGAARRDRFYRVWVCKEACLKGTGAGIAEDLARFDLSSVLRHPRIEIELADRHWTVVSLNAPVGYAAAVAVDAICPALSLRALGADAAGAEVAFI